jgi:hypothetical protein
MHPPSVHHIKTSRKEHQASQFNDDLERGHTHPRLNCSYRAPLIGHYRLVTSKVSQAQRKYAVIAAR